MCEVSCAYEHQCVHYLSTNGGKFVMSQFDIRQLKQDVGSGLCLSKKNAEVVKYPSEHIEIEENEYYNGMEKGINHIPYVESN